eukprot:gb/GECH01014948.1/.p1 GENE.gb/GECH01014948.1/~~gb/GECH01014948.1/.p1  ORF type:complete len:929 (+),score=208.42 gb/GECH01014948.1/:1-2787(+)
MSQAQSQPQSQNWLNNGPSQQEDKDFTVDYYQRITELIEELEIIDPNEIITHTAYKICNAIQHKTTLSSYIESNKDREVYLAVISIFLSTRIDIQKEEENHDEQEKPMEQDDNTSETEWPPLKLPNPNIDGISFINVLSNTDVSIVDFFDILNSCIATLQFENTEFDKTVKIVQRKLIVCSALYDIFRDSFPLIFSPQSPVQSASSSPNSNNDIEPLFELGWNLFLILKNHLFGASIMLDIEKAFKLFISSILFLWERSPQRKKYAEDKFDVLKALGVEPEEFKDEFDDTISSFINQNCFSGKIAEDCTDILEVIQDKYEEFLRDFSSVDFDERYYVSRPACIGNIYQLTSGPITFSYSPKQASSKSSSNPFAVPATPPRTPTQSQKSSQFTSKESPQCPVRQTINFINSLKQVLQSQPAEPSSELKRFFSQCDPNPEEQIVSRISEMAEKINFSSLQNQTELENRRKLIKKLYFRVLEVMLIGEERKLGESKFEALLNNHSFHRSMIVCAQELVLFAYNATYVSSLVPILRTYNLQPYDFVKIIQSFSLHTSWLSGHFHKHLKALENHIMESAMWLSDSIIYTKIEQYESRTQSKAGSTVASSDNAPSVYSSAQTPLAKKQSSFQVYTASPAIHSKNTQSIRKGTPNPLDFIFKKLYQLTATRIHELCDTLPQIPSFINKVWELMYHIFTEERDFLKDRHIDQLIMCSIYAISKVNKKPIKFSDIIANYRHICENIRKCSAVQIGKVVWQVTLDQTHHKGDIVKFYNAVFISRLREHIVESADLPHTPQRGGMMMSPQRSPQRAPPLPASSPHRVRGNVTVFLSPSQESQKWPSSMTPRTKTLYAFGEGFTQKLNEHNFSQSSQTRSSRNSKRTLQFDDVPEEEMKRKKYRRLASLPGEVRHVSTEDKENNADIVMQDIEEHHNDDY